MKQKQKLHKSTKIIMTISMLICFMSIFVSIYFTGYNHGLRKANDIIQSAHITITYEGVKGAESFGLFNTTINGINVYSDVNDFSRIKTIMNNIKVSNSSYTLLKSIVYYQNASINGYYEPQPERACDGSFLPYMNEIYLYRCDGEFKVRDSNVSDNNSEEFILGHELAHYAMEEHESSGYLFTEKCADNYGMSLIKNG